MSEGEIKPVYCLFQWGKPRTHAIGVQDCFGGKTYRNVPGRHQPGEIFGSTLRSKKRALREDGTSNTRYRIIAKVQPKLIRELMVRNGRGEFLESGSWYEVIED